MNQFRCQHCGSTQLAYVQYIRHLIPVDVDQNGNYAYLYPVEEEDNTSVTEQGYCCGECGQMLQYHSVLVQTEKKLLDYLKYLSRINL